MENKITAILPAPFYIEPKEAEFWQLVHQLKENLFVAVIGESGSGKSTYIDKSLREWLNINQVAGLQGKQWRIVKTTPAGDPIGNLAEDLAKASPDALFPPASISIDLRNSLETTLREKNNPLSEIYEKELVKSEEPFNFLLIVDQLEDLLRYQAVSKQGQQAGDDVRYINTLISATKSKYPIYVVVISDSQHLGAYTRFRGLPEMMNNFRYNIQKVDKEQVKKALDAAVPGQADAHSAIVQKLLTDFEAIQQNNYKGAFALEKLSLFMSNNLNRLPQRAKIGAFEYTKDELLRKYEKANLLEDVMPAFMDQVVQGQNMAWCSVIFKALTDKGFETTRRPVTFSDLQTLIQPFNQDIKPSFDQILQLLQSFNTSGRTILKISGKTELSPNNIVDIVNDSLLYNWPQLVRWINEEGMHAETFKRLVRNADTYFGAQLPEETLDEKKPALFNFWTTTKQAFGIATREETSVNMYLSEGAELAGALDWYTHCKPGFFWASRYDIESFEHKNPTSLQFKKAFGNRDSKEVKQLEIALKFLEISKKRSDGLSGQLKREVAVAKRQRKIATILGAFSVLAMVVSVFFMRKAMLEKRNIQLIDYLSILSNTGVLNIPAYEKYGETRLLSHKIANDPSIDSKKKMLEYLNRNTDYLPNRSGAPAESEMIQSLMNMDDIFHPQKVEEAEASQETFLQLYQDVMSSSAKDPVSQHPYLFYNLYYRLKFLQLQDSTAGAVTISKEIYPDALVPNPKMNGEYALGDKDGNVYIHLANDTLLLQGNVASSITTLAYSPNGEELYAGTEQGSIYRFKHLSLSKGIPLEERMETIFSDPINKNPIYFIEYYPETNEYFVCANYDLFFIQPGKKPLRGKESISQGRFNACDMGPDRKSFFVSGNNATMIYTVDPSKKNPGIYPTGSIVHPGKNMTSLALKYDTAQGKTIAHLAVGFGDGDIWVASMEPDFTKKMNTNLEKEAIRFNKLPKVHDFNIVSLVFNPEMDQLLSASVDGTAQLWNLNMLDTKGDHIRLYNFGQSINKAIYNSKNEAVIYQITSPWVVKTNVEALWDELDCYIKTKKNCTDGIVR